MSYLVMECHTSYAVVLDEQGRFLKVANLNYEVGQRVERVIEIQVPESTSQPRSGRLAPFIAVAACFCLVFLGAWQFLLNPFGTVRMQINPDVMMSVNLLGYVVDLEGLNEDGEVLVAGVGTFGKKVDVLSDELADHAVQMGYLQEGGKISLTVDSSHAGWKSATEELLVLELEVHLQNSVSVVTIPVIQPDTPSSSHSEPGQEVIVPLHPADDDDDPDADDEDHDRDDDAADRDDQGNDDDPDDHDDDDDQDDQGDVDDKDDDGSDDTDDDEDDRDDDNSDDGRQDDD